jgi:hypothetical protein
MFELYFWICAYYDSGARQGRVAGSSEHGKAPSGSVESWEIVE